jgi:hypothetical protein
MPEADAFLLGIVWWNTATKSFQGMECQNLLPYICDVKGAMNDITMSWVASSSSSTRSKRQPPERNPPGTRSGQTSRPPHLFRLGNMATPADPGNGCSRFTLRGPPRRRA